jgi:hypothetical protein
VLAYCQIPWKIRRFQGVQICRSHRQECVWVVAVYRGADESLAQPERKQATATKDFEFHISYL